MGQEKLHAFWQSWFAMGWAMLEAMQKASIAMLMGARVPMIDAERVLSHGLAPVHERAGHLASQACRRDSCASGPVWRRPWEAPVRVRIAVPGPTSISLPSIVITPRPLRT